jgi:hypothetical protein
MAAKNARRKKVGENVTSEKKKVCLLKQIFVVLINNCSQLEDMVKIPEKNQKEIIELEKLIQRHESDKTELESKLLKATATLQEKVVEPQGKLVKLEKDLAGLSKTKEEKASAVCG